MYISNKWLCGNEKLMGECDMDSVLFIAEQQIYDLVDFLINDMQRLCGLIVEAREQANMFAAKLKCIDLPYPMAEKGVFDDSFDDRPTMQYYHKLFSGRWRS